MAKEGSMVKLLPDQSISSDRKSVVSSKGTTYFYCKAVKKDQLRFFTKNVDESKHTPLAIPEDFEVVENTRTSLPMARRKKQ